MVHHLGDDEYPFVGVISLPLSQVTAFTDLSPADYQGFLRDIHQWWRRHQQDSQSLHHDQIPSLYFSPEAELGISKQQWRRLRQMWTPPYDD